MANICDLDKLLFYIDTFLKFCRKFGLILKKEIKILVNNDVEYSKFNFIIN